MKSLLDRFFIARIDRALDDARPLDAMTARYVRKHPKLRDYYEKMLELEIELRFSEADFPLRPSAMSPSRTDIQPASMFSRRTIAAALVVLLALTAAISYRLISPSPPSDEFAGEEQKIDPAELIALGDSLRNAVRVDIVRPESWAVGDIVPPFEFPVDSIVAFAEQPIGSTLALLERVRVVDGGSDDL